MEISFTQSAITFDKELNELDGFALEFTQVLDAQQLKRRKKENFKERLEFIDKYVAWQKSVPNKKWSRAQKNIVDSKPSPKK